MSETQARGRQVTRADLARVLFLAAAVLFVVAALMAGSVIHDFYVPWLIGGFAAVALAWAIG